MSEGVDSAAVREYLLDLQQTIAGRLCHADPLIEDRVDEWTRPAGGGGISWVLGNGAVFEKAGVNFSDVSGDSLPPSATAARPRLAGCGFRAMGVSVVIHPCSPYIPTTHMNVRFFQATPIDGKGEGAWWFGGGFDLTPYYPFEADAIFWHAAARAACAPFEAEYAASPAGQESPGLYASFKAWCDRYFYLKHRDETRGVGGLFFDDFDALGFDRSFAFMRSVGDAFMPAYMAIAERRRFESWGERERAFQLYRRGRYVEFNLLYDRGTLFGLQSGGRTESILMSLPPLVRWEYDYRAEPGSPEAALQDYLKPRDWLAAASGR